MDKQRRKLVMNAAGAAGAGALLSLPATASAQSGLSAADISYRIGLSGDLRNVQAKLDSQALLDDFGAVGDGTTDDRIALDKAIQYVAQRGGGRIYLGPKNYFLHDTVFIPEGVHIQFVGEDSGKTFVTSRNHGAPVIRYVRSNASGASSSTLSFHGITFQELGFSKTPGGCAVMVWGHDITAADNYLYISACTFVGYDCAVWTRFVGLARFTDLYCWGNVTVHRMDRAASFHWFNNCLSLGNKTWIDADDSRGLPTGEYVSDGISNTIIIDGCVSVQSTGDDIRINGWQAVYIAKGGCDGGSGLSGAAIHLMNVEDFSIDSMYLSCTSNTQGRAALFLEDCRRGVVRGCTLTWSDTGLLQKGPSPSSATAVGDVSTRLVVDGNFFLGNRRCDISTLGYLRSSKIVNNHFESVVPQTGAEYNLYVNEINSTSNIVSNNTFTCAPYPIYSGQGSVISANVFNAK